MGCIRFIKENAMRNRYVVIATAVGFVIPCLVLSISLFDRTFLSCLGSLPFLLWPAAMLMLFSIEFSKFEFIILAISITINALLYGVFGYLLWLGIKSKKIFLLVLVVLISLIYYVVSQIEF